MQRCSQPSRFYLFYLFIVSNFSPFKGGKYAYYSFKPVHLLFAEISTLHCDSYDYYYSSKMMN